MISPAAHFGLIEDFFFWGGMFWWIWLFLVAWYFYSWAQEHLAFSPVLATVVAGILIYYLVIQYPLIGSLGYVFSILIFSGLLWMLPIIVPFVPGLNLLMKK